MDISELALKLIILLAPGALAASINRMLTVRHKSQSDFMFVIVSILYGMFSYLVLQLLNLFCVFLYNIFHSDCHHQYQLIKTFSKISDKTIIPYSEVLFASLISIFIGFLMTRIDSTKSIYKLAQNLKISTKYGDENLFSYFLNSSDIEWVYIRDISNSLTYLGVVRIFSETEEFKEIVLEQVSVFNYPESEELYEIERIYLCLPKDKVIIEQAKFNNYGEKGE